MTGTPVNVPLLNGEHGYGSMHWLLVGLVAAICRVLWRLSTPLPPWAESLSNAERRIASLAERTLLGVLFVIAATGLVLVLGEEDDVLVVHVAAHVVFFAALVVHLGLVLGRGLRGRPVLLRRMLGPSRPL